MPHMTRTTLYCGASTLLCAAVILNAFEARPNFFAAAMYLSQSSACLMVLTNMFLVCTLIGGKILQNIFFGRLRAIEVDHLYERAWYAVTETCLAMTIFRDEFDTSFFLFFTLLIAIKIFHWLAQDRIEYMEQTVEVRRSFHVRMVSIISLLLVVDLVLVRHCMRMVFARSSNVMIMFAFEFAILAYTIAAVAGKYILNLIEARRTETWDNKSVYVFYLELSTDFVKLVTYFAFFATLMTFYGFPLHIIRDLYVTLRSFTTKCRNFMRFRKATQDMDSRYPNATVAELEATGDKTCIVCREDMLHGTQPVPEGEPAHTALDNPKRLPCGHILHFRCLRSWLERQQTCPMCRRPVLDDNATRNDSRDGIPRPGRDVSQNPAPTEATGQQPQAPPGADHTGDERPGRFQMHRQQGSDTVQLPRGFRLPPGWALLPVSTAPAPPAEQSSQPQATDAQATPASSPTDQTTNPRPRLASARLPPVIPLFNAGLGHTASVSTTLPPQLTDEQITSMESSTRRTVEERLRLLGEIQSRITEAFTMLTRLQSIPVPPATPSPVPDRRPSTTTPLETEQASIATSATAEEGGTDTSLPLPRSPDNPEVASLAPTSSGGGDGPGIASHDPSHH